MSEYLWILASLLLVIGWLYVKDFIRTDKKSGDMDWYTGVVASIGVLFVYKFINNMFMKNISMKSPKYRV